MINLFVSRTYKMAAGKSTKAILQVWSNLVVTWAFFKASLLAGGSLSTLRTALSLLLVNAISLLIKLRLEVNKLEFSSIVSSFVSSMNKLMPIWSLTKRENRLVKIPAHVAQLDHLTTYLGVLQELEQAVNQGSHQNVPVRALLVEVVRKMFASILDQVVQLIQLDQVVRVVAF